MSTLTSRLKLLKPDRLELVNVLSHLNANLDRLDAGGNGAYVCTSTTRPNGVNYPLFDGMMIFEGDTSRYYMRQSGDWLRIPANPQSLWAQSDIGATPEVVTPGQGRNVYAGPEINIPVGEAWLLTGAASFWIRFAQASGSVAGHAYLRVDNVELGRARLASTSLGAGLRAHVTVGGWTSRLGGRSSGYVPNIRIESDAASAGNMEIYNATWNIKVL